MRIMETVEEILNETVGKIKRALLREARQLDPFPEMLMGFQKKKYASQGGVAHGMLGSVDVSSRGIALPRKGIEVHDEDKFWTQNNYVILLPSGLYTFRASMFLATKDGKPINLVESYPDWNSKREVNWNYLAYGERAIRLIRRLKQKEVVSV